jgi:putative ABC transport system ATP-binding protein
MKKLNEEHGVTFIFSTHDQRVMEEGRRTVVLSDGMVESDKRI